MNITDIPRLSEKDEIELARRIEAGVYASHLIAEQEASDAAGELLAVVRDGRVAWDRFFLANMPLVIHIAASWSAGNQMASLEDRIQQGSVALLKAMTAWDHNRGVPFGAFARKHIDAATRPAVVPIEVPLPAELSESSESSARMSFLSVSSQSCGSEASQVRPIDLMQAAWRRLASWQREVLALRFGLSGGEPLSYARLAAHLGVSYREVRRLEKCALSALRECSLAERYALTAV